VTVISREPPMNPLETKHLPEKPRVIFFGTPPFAVPTLKSLVGKGHKVLGVVTQPDRPKGRGRKLMSPPIKQAALELGLHIMQPEKASDPCFCSRIAALLPDLLVVVAFGQILKENLLEIPMWGALNIHASLLPRYRGAAPIQWAVLNNEPRTGLSAMRMDEGLDTGPVLYQEDIPIPENETAGELHDRLSSMAGRFILAVLEDWTKGKLSIKEQDDSLATYAPKIERHMALIDWSRSVVAIHGQIRAFDPWPGATTTLAGKQLKLFSSRMVPGDVQGGVPGRVTKTGETGIVVEAGDGLIEVGALQLAGKKRLPANEFLRGFPLAEGIVLGE
jgi:methionyl-tRNA formyltransferase